MNDYKELIENLRMAGKSVELADGSFDTYLLTAGKCQEIADAIEQLVKERDAAVADLHLVANNCFEDYVFSACCCCKKNDTCTGCEFEWRGV